MATTYPAKSGDVVLVNSEDAVKAPWTVLFPPNPLNNYRVTIADTSDNRPASPIELDFNGKSYFHGRLDPTSGPTLSLRQPGETWEWVFNATGQFWYPINQRLPLDGEAYGMTARMDDISDTPTDINLILETTVNTFFSLSGATLTALRPGTLRVDLYSQWECDIANNQDAGVVIEAAITAGSPLVDVGILADIFQSSRGGLFPKSANSLGIITVDIGDAFKFQARSYTGQTGTTDLLDLIFLFVPFT